MAKGMDRSFHEQNSRVNDFFRSDSKNLNDVMCHLKEQNQLLITMCNDLSDELLTVQQRKVELKSKIDSDVNNSNRDVNNQSLVWSAIGSIIWSIGKWASKWVYTMWWEVDKGNK